MFTRLNRISPRLGILAASLLTSAALFGCAPEDEAFEPELEPGQEVGKADNAGIPSLPVDGNYSQTMAWEVENQWEDTDTAAAREAGIVWGADSGLNWDEKYQLWLQEMDTTTGFSGNKTFMLKTPWGKELQAPKLDCADTALALRATFAAWYNLPFYVVSFDGGTPVYFGHFGIRTASGKWGNMPNFNTAYSDFSDMSADEALANWPKDTKLRKRGVQDGDDQPNLEDGARTGAWLDEIHLNKKAANFVRLMLIFNGSANLADSRNTFNLAPEAIAAGDVMLWRWQRHGIGHTMFTVRVDDIGDGRLEAQAVQGSLPPIQAQWMSPSETKLAYTNEFGGGHDGEEDYAPNNGGLKRFRVAKPVNGNWVNTWMADDEASWVNDTDLETMRRRPQQFENLLGEVSPEQLRDTLLGIISSKRAHLQDFPASCSARIKREENFDKLYDLMESDFGMSKAEVDAQFRSFEDYVFAELVYEESKTCCWNSTNRGMYDTVMDLNNEIQAEADANMMCVQPTVFKNDNGYDVFKDHNPIGWVDWSEDEPCSQRDVATDTEEEFTGTEFCEWKDGSGDDGGGSDLGNSCVGHCGDHSEDESCWCDSFCTQNGDCCADKVEACG